MRHKSITFGELRNTLNSLTIEQLQMPAKWTGEERGGVIGGVEILGEEYVDTGEGLEPRSLQGEVFDETDVVARYPAGTVFLLTDLTGDASEIEAEPEARPALESSS